VHNYFHAVNPLGAAASRVRDDAQMARGTRGGATMLRSRDVLESRIPSAFLQCSEFLTRVSAARRIFGRAFYHCAFRRRRRARGAALTHKIKQSHC
jgi:hypothetical protein